MNDFLTILQKTGAWIWNQKEKMVLLILVGVLCFRVYQVVNGPAPQNTSEGMVNASNEPEPQPPGLRPDRPRPADYQSLVQRNPFSIWGISSGGDEQRGGEQRIDLTLVRIVPWNDGTYRAEIISSRDTRARRYEEGEPFEGYRIISIDPAANTVTVYSSEYDKNFTLKAQQAAP